MVELVLPMQDLAMPMGALCIYAVEPKVYARELISDKVMKRVFIVLKDPAAVELLFLIKGITSLPSYLIPILPILTLYYLHLIIQIINVNVSIVCPIRGILDSGPGLIRQRKEVAIMMVKVELFYLINK